MSKMLKPDPPIAVPHAARRMLTQVKVDPDLLKPANTPLYAFQLSAVIDLANLMGVPASSVVRAGVQMVLEAYSAGNPGQILAMALEEREKAEKRAKDSPKAIRAEEKMVNMPDTTYLFGNAIFVQETRLDAAWAARLFAHARATYPMRGTRVNIGALCKEAVQMLYRHMRMIGFDSRLNYTHNLALLVPVAGVRRSVLLRAALHLYIKHHKIKV